MLFELLQPKPLVRSMSFEQIKFIHQASAWLLCIFSTMLAVALIYHGETLPGLIALALASVVFPLFVMPLWIKVLVMLVAFVVL